MQRRFPPGAASFLFSTMLQQILPGLFTFSNLIVGRVYLVEDSDGLTLVDTGPNTAARQIDRALSASGRQLDQVRRIVITHAHPDHASNLPWLKARSGAALFGSAKEKDVLEGRLPMESLAIRAGKYLPKLYLPVCTLDHLVVDGDELPFFGGVRAISSPGHTKEQMAYWQPEKRVLFCGDTIIRFPHTRPPFKIFTQNPLENARSIMKLNRLSPAVLLPGHGRPIIANTAQHLAQFAAKTAERYNLLLS